MQNVRWAERILLKYNDGLWSVYIRFVFRFGQWKVSKNFEKINGRVVYLESYIVNDVFFSGSIKSDRVERNLSSLKQALNI